MFKTSAKEGNRKLVSLELEKLHDTHVINSCHFKSHRKAAFFVRECIKEMSFYKELIIHFYFSMYFLGNTDPPLLPHYSS